MINQIPSHINRSAAPKNLKRLLFIALPFMVACTCVCPATVPGCPDCSASKRAFIAVLNTLLFQVPNDVMKAAMSTVREEGCEAEGCHDYLFNGSALKCETLEGTFKEANDVSELWMISIRYTNERDNEEDNSVMVMKSNGKLIPIRFTTYGATDYAYEGKPNFEKLEAEFHWELLNTDKWDTSYEGVFCEDWEHTG